MITIKLIFHYQVRQRTRKEKDKWEMREKIMSLCLASFFSSKIKKKTYESEIWVQFVKN